MALKIMNWNIEQFGEKRSGNAVILNGVVSIVKSESPDIFTIIEVKTTSPAKAINVAKKLCTELKKQKMYYNYIVSYSNGLEIYVVLYKPDIVFPFVIETGHKNMYTREEISLLDLTLLKDADKMSYMDKSELHYYSPLLYFPDRGCKRPPAVTFFMHVETKFCFALISWHNMAGKYNHHTKKSNDYIPKKIMKKVAKADYIKDGFAFKCGKTDIKIPNVIFTADFNVDYTLNKDVYCEYDNYGVTLNEGTMLIHYAADNQGKYDKSTKLRGSAYDNFLIKFPEKQVKGSCRVVDIPEAIYQHKDKIGEKLILSGCLTSESTLVRIAKENIVSEFIYPDDEGEYISKPKVAENIILKAKIVNGKVDEISIKGLKKILREEYYKELLEAFNKKIKDSIYVYKHFNSIVDPKIGADFDYNDTLFLTRVLLSDHLPIVLTIS